MSLSKIENPHGFLSSFRLMFLKFMTKVLIQNFDKKLQNWLQVMDVKKYEENSSFASTKFGCLMSLV
jgi:hypothetical protein